jgi:hypothetical protein
VALTREVAMSERSGAGGTGGPSGPTGGRHGPTGDVGGDRDTQDSHPTFDLRRYAERRRTAMLGERQPWESDAQECSEYVDPTRGRFDGNPSGTTVNPSNGGGRRSRRKILDSRATEDVRIAASGLSSHMTSKSRPWMQVDASIPELRDNHEVRLWTSAVTDEIRDTLAKSNFYKAMPSLYTEDLMFPSAVMLITEHPELFVNFNVLTWGTYAIGLDAFGEPDSLYRWFRRTARQLEQTYGRNNLPPAVRKCLADKPDQYFNVESLIEKNPNAEPGLGPMGLQARERRPWREIIWILGGMTETHGVMRIEGYYEQPFAVARFNPVGDEVYSSSPCLDALGDIKQLQYNHGQKLRLLDLMAEPPLGVPDVLQNRPASLAPRTKTYLPSSQSAQTVGPIYTPDPRGYQSVREEIQAGRAAIDDKLFRPLFLMLASLEDRERTATEIAERRDERATVLGPTVESITAETLDVTIVRVFRILERAGRIPAAPAVLANVPLKIEYTSILAQALKANAVASIERFFGFMAGVVQATGDVSHYDKLDTDQMADEYAIRTNVPPKIIRSDEAAAAIRGARAQQARLQQMASMAKPAADIATAATKMAETVPQDDSMLANLQASIGGGP